ncbi:MAG TPA: ABC transporter ATP-binding protein [Bordetella sp.]|nr:ABC transporter ATP-binding protein [Bordetella sp.]
MTQPVLSIRKLCVDFVAGDTSVQALRNISFDIAPGQALGLVGESGSGKSTLALAALGLLDEEARIREGAVLFQGADLYAMDEDGRRALRGDKISIVFQDPFTSLNPSLRVGRQIAEPLLVHRGFTPQQADAECIRLLEEVGIHDPRKMMRSYPHQLSGGMKQRALIAAALACDPELLILDEPTTALDVTVEAQILELLAQLRAVRNLSMLFISHNLGVIARVCDEVCVLYAGEVLEQGPTSRVLVDPRHPYTKGLLASLPHLGDRRHRLEPIPGRLPHPSARPAGCVFSDRCAFVQGEGCAQHQPMVAQEPGHDSRCWRSLELAGQGWRSASPQPLPATPRAVPPAGSPMVTVQGLERSFDVGGWRLPRFLRGRNAAAADQHMRVKAVDGVSLHVGAGEVVGLVGESGCGKTTLGRCLINLVHPSAGAIRIDGKDLVAADARGRRAILKDAQMVFQNPDSSLNPRKTVREILARPMQLFGIVDSAAGLEQEVLKLLDTVRLGAHYADRYPHQMSGGEKQRIGIARALATRPRFIVCDEAVSALDVSVQASILNLLSDLRDQLGVAYLFISHDLAVVSHIADRICVMYKGKIVEEGATESLIADPRHPYTQKLLSSVSSVEKHAGRAAGGLVRDAC